jgi:hypothetical protein
MQKIKGALLATGQFLDNEYLDKYVNLIYNNLHTKKETAKTQRHHILPKCYFKLIGKPCDNTKVNIVNLLYIDHARAHFYLSLCLNDKILAGKNALVLKYILNQVHQKQYTSIEDLLVTNELQQYYEVYGSYLSSEEYRQKKSAQAKEQFKDGYVWITDGTTNHTVSKIDTTWAERFPGFYLGRSMSPESQQKRSEGGKLAYANYTAEQKLSLSERMRKRNPNDPPRHKHRVYCVDLDKVFDTIKEAASFVGTTSCSISSCCTYAQLKAANHFWAYTEDTERIQFIKDHYLSADNIYTNYTFRPKSVRCVETGVVYSDMTAAAKALGMHGPSHISTACKTGRKSGGYHWEYAD